MPRFFYLAIFAIAFCACPIASFAQFGNSGGGGGGGGGGMGGGGFGGGGGGSGMGGGGGFGGGMGGGMGGGLGGGLGGGMGGTPGSGLGGTGGFGQQAGANGQQQQGFLGRNTNQQNQFLGRNTQGQGQTGGNQGQNNNNRRGGGGNRNNNQMNGMDPQQQQLGAQGSRGTANQLPAVRPRQKVAFEYPKPKLERLIAGLEVRLQKRTNLKGVSLALEDSGDLVLKGEVASYADAKLAENLARLEPGVQTVRNELNYPTESDD